MTEYILKYKDWLELKGIRNVMYLYMGQDIITNIGLENLSDKSKIDEFILKIKQTKSISTTNLYIVALRKLLEYNNITVDTPKLFKKQQRLVNYITIEELDNNLIPMVKVLYEKNPLRIIALLYFMFYTGYRKQDIYNLKRADISLVDNEVKILEKKTNSERIAYFPNKLKEILDLYFSLEPEVKNAFNIGKTTIENICKKLAPYTIKKQLHPHMLRHGYAVNLLKNGLSLDTVRDLMNHKNIETTAVYTKLNRSDIKEMYLKKIK